MYIVEHNKSTSAVTWHSAHEHIVADTLHSMKSSSVLLLHDQPVSTTNMMPFKLPFNCLW